MTNTFGWARRLPLALALAALLPARAQATPGTCTVMPRGVFIFARVPSAGDFPFPLLSVNGLPIPVDIDAASGTFTMRRGGLPEATADTGLAGFFHTQLAGRTPSADRCRRQRVPARRAADADVRMTALPIAPTLSTGTTTRSSRRRGPRSWVPSISDGILTLVGPDIIPNAPIVNEPTITELHVTCRLDPIPAQASLPPAPSAKVNGTAKISGAEEGDTLRVKAKLKRGHVPFDFAGADLFVRLATGDGTDVVVAVVNGGALTAKGKKFSAKDGAGSVIEVPTGKKPAPAPGEEPPPARDHQDHERQEERRAQPDPSRTRPRKPRCRAGDGDDGGPNVAPAGVTVRGSGKRTFH
jgi:hypothetical protein